MSTIEIPAFHADETDKILNMMKEEHGMDITKCCICGTEIKRFEREPHGLIEKIRARFGRKYYDWNINGIMKEHLNISTVHHITKR